MNQAHVHLIVNHLPIMGVVIGFLVLVTGYFLKNTTVKQTALGIFAFSAIGLLPAFLTGEGAEEVVEGVAGIDEAFIEEHEDQAKIFTWSVGILGALSLLTFYLEWKAKSISKTLYLVVFVLGLASIVTGRMAGNSGGEIRHTEIRSGAVGTPAQEGNGGENGGKNEKEDEH